MAQDGITAEDVTWLSSPFLRCLQTSDEALNMFKHVDMDSVKINPEYSVWEIDGHGGKAHASLPALTERKCYFPRLNETYESVFVPALPGELCCFLVSRDLVELLSPQHTHFQIRRSCFREQGGVC